MFDTQFYFTLIIVGAVISAMVIYIIKGKLDQKKTPPDAYRWKPEQDYDVEMQGEGPMTPGFPVLKKREDPGPINIKKPEPPKTDKK